MSLKFDRKLGEGAFGDVWLAQDDLGRSVGLSYSAPEVILFLVRWTMLVLLPEYATRTLSAYSPSRRQTIRLVRATVSPLPAPPPSPHRPTSFWSSSQSRESLGLSFPSLAIASRSLP
jgi:hypothetical protein